MTFEWHVGIDYSGAANILAAAILTFVAPLWLVFYQRSNERE